MINNRGTTGRIDEWDIDLMPYGITYISRSFIKSHALPGFMAKKTETQSPSP
jgi:hypothetical protein